MPGDNPEGVIIEGNPATGEVTARASHDDDHDGVIPEPGKAFANLLWFLVILVLCLAVLALTGAIVLLSFTPATPAGTVDAATLVAVLSTMLAALVSFYSSRQRR